MNKITTEYYIIYNTDIFKRNYKILIKFFVVAPCFKHLALLVSYSLSNLKFLEV